MADEVDDAGCMNCGWGGRLDACPTVRNPCGFYPSIEWMRVCPECGQPTIIQLRAPSVLH